MLLSLSCSFSRPFGFCLNVLNLTRYHPERNVRCMRGHDDAMHSVEVVRKQNCPSGAACKRDEDDDNDDFESSLVAVT